MHRTIQIPLLLLQWFFLVAALAGNIESAFGQTDSCHFYFDKNLNDTIYTEASNPPMYGEKEADLFNYLAENIKVETKQINSTSEKIFISITIDKQGKIIASEIIKGGNDEVNPILLSQINEMTGWTPANCNERNVNFKMTIPMYIHLKQ